MIACMRNFTGSPTNFVCLRGTLLRNVTSAVGVKSGVKYLVGERCCYNCAFNGCAQVPNLPAKRSLYAAPAYNKRLAGKA